MLPNLLALATALCTLAAAPAGSAQGLSLGPLFEEFSLTLQPPGRRVEALGPFYYHEDGLQTRLWGSPPLFSYAVNDAAELKEFDFLYPLLSYDRFGDEYRFHIGQLFSFAGGIKPSGTNAHRFTLFPIFFSQRSADPDHNYTAVIPFAGRLRGRLFRDQVDFVLMPLYVRTVKRAGAFKEVDFRTYRGGLRTRFTGTPVVTYNFVYPFFHLRHGQSLHGWQLWPVYGREHKDFTTSTNNWGDVESVGGHDKRFILWPFFIDSRQGVGTDNPQHFQVVLPFYSIERSPQRNSTTIVWPFGYTYTDDKVKGFKERSYLWPFFIFADGPGKTTRRVFPFYSRSYNSVLERNAYLWPVYKYSRINAPPLDRRRSRILFFLYSDTRELNTESGARYRRREFLPFYSLRQNWDGSSRLQVFTVLEPFLPNSKSIERDYSPLWSFWRAERNPAQGTASQSLLWNLYRRETGPDSKKCSLLFGLFQYQSTAAGARGRVLFIPFGAKKKDIPASPGGP